MTKYFDELQDNILEATDIPTLDDYTDALTQLPSKQVIRRVIRPVETKSTPDEWSAYKAGYKVWAGKEPIVKGG